MYLSYITQNDSRGKKVHTMQCKTGKIRKIIKNESNLNFLTSSHNINRVVEKPKTPLSGFLKSTN